MSKLKDFFDLVLRMDKMKKTKSENDKNGLTRLETGLFDSIEFCLGLTLRDSKALRRAFAVSTRASLTTGESARKVIAFSVKLSTKLGKKTKKSSEKAHGR